MGEALKEAQGFADQFVDNLNKRIAAMPRVAVSALPRQYNGVDQFRAMLSRPSTYYQNHEYRLLTARSKALCKNYQHQSEGKRAVIEMRYDDVQELPHGGKMLVKTTHRSYRYCEECAKRWYGIGPISDIAPGTEWRVWVKPKPVTEATL